MKRRITAAIALVLCVFLLYGCDADYGAISDPQGKISTELMSDIRNIRSGEKVPVMVTFLPYSEKSHYDLAMEMFKALYPEDYKTYMKMKFSSGASGNFDQALERKQAVMKEVYTEYNTAILNDYVEKSDWIYVTGETLSAIIYADKDTLAQMAADDRIESIGKTVSTD